MIFVKNYELKIYFIFNQYVKLLESKINEWKFLILIIKFVLDIRKQWENIV